MEHPRQKLLVPHIQLLHPLIDPTFLHFTLCIFHLDDHDCEQGDKGQGKEPRCHKGRTDHPEKLRRYLTHRGIGEGKRQKSSRGGQG